MSQYFEIARAWLAALDPAAPAAALVLTVFLAIYSVRRWLPGAWLWVEARIPFADALDYRPIATIVWKFAQALPGALLGAAVASLSSGASVKNALLGVLAGFAASAVHEVMSAYRGQVGAPPAPPAPPLKQAPRRISFSPPKVPDLPPDSATMTVIGFFALLTGIVLCVSLSGCGLFGSKFTWPDAVSCLPTPAKREAQVEAILLAGGDYKTALEQLALSDGGGAVECAVDAFVHSFGANTPEQAAAHARGKAFLASTGTKVDR